MNAEQPFATDRPSVARMYDYTLGGHHNLPIDREMIHRAAAIYPDSINVALANRAFLRRAVRALCAEGVTQFLDIGSGLPTVENVHTIAQAAHPDACIVYVDYDPVAVAHSKAILEIEQARNAAVVQGDAREPEQILGHPEVQSRLDWSKPIAVLLVAVLHYLTDDRQASRAVQVLGDAVPPGSYLAISHGTTDQVPPEVTAQLEQLLGRSSSSVRSRSGAEIRALFAGWELLPPGLVYLPQWRPDPEENLFRAAPERSAVLVGVGRKAAGALP